MENKQITGVRYDLLPNEIKSKYLDSGCSSEILDLSSIRFDFIGRTAKGIVDVQTKFENDYEDIGKDNSWHWSAITAYRAVSQLATAYICSELGKNKNEIGEIMQISSKMNTRGVIKKKDMVYLYLNFNKYIKRNKRLLGELEFDVENSFDGSIRFAVDL